MFRCSTEHFKNIYSHSGSCRSVGAGLKNFKRTTWSVIVIIQTWSYRPAANILAIGYFWGRGGGGCKKSPTTPTSRKIKSPSKIIQHNASDYHRYAHLSFKFYFLFMTCMIYS